MSSGFAGNSEDSMQESYAKTGADSTRCMGVIWGIIVFSIRCFGDRPR